MRRVVLLALVLACACRRHHEPPVYESDTRGATPTAQTPEAAGEAPRGEPALPRRDERPRLPDGGTINGDPRGPRAAEFNRVVEGALPELRACLDRAALPPGDRVVTVHYTVEPPGYTGAVSARGDAPAEVLDCCRGVVENLRFPEFRGKKVEQDLPFTYQKREKAVRIEIWDAASKPENQ